jgi:hypothetical protein
VSVGASWLSLFLTEFKRIADALEKALGPPEAGGIAPLQENEIEEVTRHAVRAIFTGSRADSANVRVTREEIEDVVRATADAFNQILFAPRRGVGEEGGT